MCEDIDICLEQLYSNRYLAVAVSLKHVQSSRFIAKTDIYCFKNTETIKDYTVQILVKKDFPFLDELNAFINMARDSGLVAKWLNVKKIRPDYQFKAEYYGKINIDNFRGFFILWFCLVTLPSWVTFYIEKYVHYLTQKRNPLRISILLEMLIDGKRHFLKNHIKLQ